LTLRLRVGLEMIFYAKGPYRRHSYHWNRNKRHPPAVEAIRGKGNLKIRLDYLNHDSRGMTTTTKDKIKGYSTTKQKRARIKKKEKKNLRPLTVLYCSSRSSPPSLVASPKFSKIALDFSLVQLEENN